MSLSLIFRACLNEWKFPRVTKGCLESPIFVDENRTHVNSCRPMSLLAMFPNCWRKQFSTLLIIKLDPTCTITNFELRKEEPLFCKRCIFVTGSISSRIWRESMSLLFCTRTSQKLPTLGLREASWKTEVAWFGGHLRFIASYFSGGRNQSVSVGMWRSRRRIVKSGIPQWSKLGPLRAKFSVWSKIWETRGFNPKNLKPVPYPKSAYLEMTEKYSAPPCWASTRML